MSWEIFFNPINVQVSQLFINILYYLFLINNKVSESSTNITVSAFLVRSLSLLPLPCFHVAYLLKSCLLDKRLWKYRINLNENENTLKSYLPKENRDSYYVQKVPRRIGIVVHSLCVLRILLHLNRAQFCTYSS